MDFEKLKSGSVEERILLLQKMLKSCPELDSETLDVVSELRKNQDLGISFWSKKVFNKLAAATPKLPPEPLPEPPQELTQEAKVDILLRKLESVDSTFVSMEVIQRLCATRDERAKAFLIQYLGKCTDSIQISFLTKNLGICFPSEELLPVLLPFLKSEDDRVTANTLEGLEGIGSPKCVAVFAQMLDHKSNRVRANAAKALTRFDKTTAHAVLKKMLSMREKSHYVISAFHAIKELREPGFLPLLEPLIDEEIFWENCLEAVEAIGGDEAIKFLKWRQKVAVYPEQKAHIDSILSRLGENPSEEENDSRAVPNTPPKTCPFCANIIPPGKLFCRCAASKALHPDVGQSLTKAKDSNPGKAGQEKLIVSKCAFCYQEVELEKNELEGKKFCCPKCKKFSSIIGRGNEENQKGDLAELSFKSEPYSCEEFVAQGENQKEPQILEPSSEQDRIVGYRKWLGSLVAFLIFSLIGVILFQVFPERGKEREISFFLDSFFKSCYEKDYESLDKQIDFDSLIRQMAHDVYLSRLFKKGDGGEDELEILNKLSTNGDAKRSAFQEIKSWLCSINKSEYEAVIATPKKIEIDNNDARYATVSFTNHIQKQVIWKMEKRKTGWIIIGMKGIS